MVISTAVTAAATEVQAPVPTSEDLFEKGFASQTETEVASSAAASEVSTPQQSAPVATEAASVAQSVAETAAASKPSREQRIDEKEPEDPIAKANWNRWKTSTGLLEKEKQRASRAESELAAVREQRPAPAPSAAVSTTVDPDVAKIAGLRKRYAELMVEGDIDGAVKIEDEIDTIKEARYRARVLQDASAITTEKLNAMESAKTVQEVANEAFKAYPGLNHNDPGANAEAIADVKDLTQVYFNRGMSHPEALKKAIEVAAKTYFPDAQVTTEAATEAASVAVSAPIDEAALKAMAAVKTRPAPVKTNQKPKGGGSFDDGFEAYISKT